MDSTSNKVHRQLNKNSAELFNITGESLNKYTIQQILTGPVPG